MGRNWDLKSATEAFEKGAGQDWIERYLQVEAWQNPGLLRRVRAYSTSWLPPQLIAIADLGRIAGPSASFRFPQDPVEWNRAVQTIADTQPSRDSLPPVIAWREQDGRINLADGNHRVDALLQLGYSSCWGLIHDGPLRSEEELARLQTELMDDQKRISEIRGLAQPARRALANAGITHAEELAAVSLNDLRQLHGIGPNAVKVLGEFLSKQGLMFKDS